MQRAEQQRLMHTAQVIRLLGTQITLSGINAQLAHTLVALAITFDDLHTPGDLSQALAAAGTRA